MKTLINLIAWVWQFFIALFCGPYLTYLLLFSRSELNAPIFVAIFLTLAGWYGLYSMLFKGEYFGF